MNKEKGLEKLLLIDKPSGMTSFGVIRILRKTLGIKKIGHAGTLDPLATGLLLVGVGEGTKELERYVGLPKEYEAEIIFGISTDTGDMDGVITKDTEADKLQKSDIERILSEMEGTLSLQVPRYSAVKQKGQPLYRRVRRGEQVEPPVREMRIDELRLLRMRTADSHMIARIRMKVASGVYVRSIAEELGRRLGKPAAVLSLRRTRIGTFDVADAKPLEAYENNS